MPSGSFTAPGASTPVGEGVQYRLNASALSAGQCDYYFGYDDLQIKRQIVMILTGTFTGSIEIQYSIDQGVTWTNVPNEVYTAPDSRRLN